MSIILLEWTILDWMILLLKPSPIRLHHSESINISVRKPPTGRGFSKTHWFEVLKSSTLLLAYIINSDKMSFYTPSNLIRQRNWNFRLVLRWFYQNPLPVGGFRKTDSMKNFPSRNVGIKKIILSFFALYGS